MVCTFVQMLRQGNTFVIDPSGLEVHEKYDPINQKKTEKEEESLVPEHVYSRREKERKGERERRGYILAHPNSVRASIHAALTNPVGMPEICPATVASETDTLRPMGKMGKSIMLQEVKGMSQKDKHWSFASEKKEEEE